MAKKVVRQPILTNNATYRQPKHHGQRGAGRYRAQCLRAFPGRGRGRIASEGGYRPEIAWAKAMPIRLMTSTVKFHTREEHMAGNKQNKQTNGNTAPFGW